MYAIAISRFGEPDVLTKVERPTPKPALHQVLVKVRATAVNRADVIQRRGYYPAPPDAPADIPGLEFAGEVEEVGASCTLWKPGDRVFGLAGGGTYAQYLVAHERTLSPIPQHLNFIEAASIPEAFITAYDAMVLQGSLSAGEKLLVSAVGSGVGTAAVQIARVIGAISIGTARQQSKLDAASSLGLNHAVLTEDGNFADAVLRASDGTGADVTLELVGGRYIAEDLKCAAPKGRIIIVGLVGGAKSEVDLGVVLRKRLTLKGTTLRARPLEEKIQAAQVLTKHLVPLFASGQLKTVIDKIFPLEESAQAHVCMESNVNIGKIVLET